MVKPRPDVLIPGPGVNYRGGGRLSLAQEEEVLNLFFLMHSSLPLLRGL
jgi:hypothetical protein